ncbi:MAG: hypothetical protein AB7V39_23685 [Nitrospiraceae bacterium]
MARLVQAWPGVHPVITSLTPEVVTRLALAQAGDLSDPGCRPRRDGSATAPVDPSASAAIRWVLDLHRDAILRGRSLVLLNEIRARTDADEARPLQSGHDDSTLESLDVRQLLLVRHPVDCFASDSKESPSLACQDSPGDVAKRWLQLLELRPVQTRIRFEDLLSSPMGALRAVGDVLELPRSLEPSRFHDAIADFRAAMGIADLAAPSADAQASPRGTVKSKSVADLCDLLGYSFLRETSEASVSTPGSKKEPVDESAAKLASPSDHPIVELNRQVSKLIGAVAKQEASLARVSEHLHVALKRELLNAVRQIEAYSSVQAAFSGGDPLPEMHGWPISADLAALLVGLIRSNVYDAVVEFGSGTSTIVIAKMLARLRNGGGSVRCVAQVAFEHLEAFRGQTLGHLDAAGLGDAVALHSAPLVPFKGPSDESYAFYDCEGALRDVAGRLARRGARVLVLVDGPPAATGPRARYPALHAVMRAFPDCALDIVLDDHFREEERQIVDMWQEELVRQGRQFEKSVRMLEKEAVIMRIAPASGE